ncbi:phage portal protein [Alteribacter populi]|uniref:phage portal protein n=1 Tax=Alteribacter populi TaxID=2011011 RepID=UPI001FE07943|nr:phage portal protein [Alteribacter populi]
MDILCAKPADLLVGEPPKFESGKDSESIEQRRINEIVENNDMTQMLHEQTTGNGYRGDAFLKTYYTYRQDISEVPEAWRDEIRAKMKREVIIESVSAKFVFPEFAEGSKKRVKAYNIAWPEFVDVGKEERVFLNVERHVPGAILYERYRMHDKHVVTEYGDSAHVPVFTVGERVNTNRDQDAIFTGVPHLLVEHIPYKATDDEFFGISGVEKLESILAALNDRLTQIDYILWKHADPAMRGPQYGGDGSMKASGKYFPFTQDETTPEYLTWNAQLDSAFKEIDYLLGVIFQMSETPQWLFGTTMTEDRGGTGTSHTDGAAIKARFMPILSKVKRIRMYVDRAVRDALWKAQMLENEANEDVDGWEPYEPVYPTVTWSDGLPKNEKELAEIYSIRTGGKPTIDQHSAIKKQDDVDDEKARETIDRIVTDETREEESFASVQSIREEPIEGDDA